ncbi:hypothetical protein [Pseudoxanthomonas gei]|nr:hypothetical protein [Pseudoxanthomonas gei]
MKKLFATATLLAITGVLAGCEGSWKVQGECTSKNQCKIGGEIGGKFLIQQRNTGSTLETLLASGIVFDAAQFSLALQGTNVGLPTNGLVTIKLMDSGTGTMHAAGAFPWRLVGGSIVLANPDSVNSWAYASASGADSIGYELHPFPVTGASAANVLSMSVNYEGTTRASSSITWSGGGACRVGTCAIQ